MELTFQEYLGLLHRLDLANPISPQESGMCLYFGDSLEKCTRTTLLETVDGITLLIGINAAGEISSIEFC